MEGPHGNRSLGRSRNRYVDLLRVIAVVLVVLGHWLAISITYHGGHLEGQDVMARLSWTEWLSLPFQVMPVFFLVGGFANAASWTSHRTRGESWGCWLYGRAIRLVAPTTAYVLVAVAVVAVCRAAKVDPAVLRRAGWAVALHLWFLPIYLGLLAVTPGLHAAHRRWGLGVPAVLALGAAGVNTAVLLSHPPLLGWADYLLVWGVVYQLGLAWHHGALTRTRRRPLTLAAMGITVLVGLVWLGPFPVSMVGVPGARIKNSAPPSVALLAFAIGQVGLLLAAEPAMTRLLRRPHLWRAVARTNRMVMTLYLWHMAPVILAAVTLYPTGLLPPAPIGSSAWLRQRLIWMFALTVLFIPMAMALRPAERLTPTRRGPDIGSLRRKSWPLLATGVAAVGFALARISAQGFAPSGRPLLPVLAVYTAGVFLLITAGRMRTRPDRRMLPTTRGN
ncbi:acyltransferase family protein [Actinoallomurus soli]|uniref:acyltransferase family protein n=1 Tax=Actinoallomurus soli TaxID=2952535 RepID=UPI002093010E|nr:acyltransferase [Actinoallomurus soli]MCO5974110.1 acyltransferase [Actinoallomurus soli]